MICGLYILFILAAYPHVRVCKPVYDEWDILEFLNILGTDPDSRLNVSSLISSKGYPVEDHTVQTKDGYLLAVQRIRYGRQGWNKFLGKRPVAFLQHGLLSSATDWVINFPKQSLGFILADAGFDVWLGNIRGNTYSRRHIKYSPDMKQFWEFSFDEMGEYDLPAMIDYALNFTGQTQLFYVGHSQGTTSAFAMLSQKPEYNKKIKLFVGLAPVATVGYMTSAIRYLAPFTSDLDFLFEILGVSEFLPNNAVMKYLSELVCNTPAKFICEDVIFLLCGTDYSQMNTTRLGVYVAHTPAGASTRSIIHYAQMINSKKFLKYDFGEKGNMQHYNQSVAPEYFVENITAPVALFWSKNDKLADGTDVALLQQKLKNVVSVTCVKYDQFNHLDFVWALHANTLVYEEVLMLLKKYSSNL
ncbi:gastric triacylglycerol lipase-like [Uloborus diversus]|uniref:gastric triacylglycerol lipase-like n=1 Tax=Uloborus diversus TaxID=327109 RepID=UPI00240A9322|nr:gastric triacylglycerol lipase-like [Uloborus diversus]